MLSARDKAKLFASKIKKPKLMTERPEGKITYRCDEIDAKIHHKAPLDTLDLRIENERIKKIWTIF